MPLRTRVHPPSAATSRILTTQSGPGDCQREVSIVPYLMRYRASAISQSRNAFTLGRRRARCG